MKKKLTLFVVGIALTALILVEGCGTIFNGTTQSISVTSQPSQAKIEIFTMGGVKMTQGVTPLKIDLQRAEAYKLVASVDGYEKAEMFLNKTLSGTVWGNLLCGGVIGFIVDFSNGAAYNLTPEQLHFDLVKKTAQNGNIETFLVISGLDEHGNAKSIQVPLVDKKKI